MAVDKCPLLPVIALLLLALTTTVHADGTLYVANPGGGTIDAINSSGVISTFASPSNYPDMLTVDSAGNIYASLASANVVEKYSSSGTDLGVYASGLNNPQGLAFDSSGSLFVADTGTSSILKITSGVTSTFVSGLQYPVGLAINSQGNIFESNVSDNSIHEYSPTGTLLLTLTSGLSIPGQIAFDSAGNLYVANQTNANVEEFAILPGGTISTVGTSFASTGLNSQPTGLAFDENGNLYVSYAYQSTSLIEKFSPTGTDLGIFASGGDLNTPIGLLYVQTTPEPATWALLLLGLPALVYLRRRQA